MPLSRIKLVPRWLVEPKYVWLSIVVIGLALIISLRPGTGEPTIRWCGLALQILGIGTVIWGVHDTRALFRHPSYRRLLADWLRRFPLLRRNVVIGVGVGEMTVAMGKARGHVTEGPGENPTVESRLAALEKNIGYLQQSISATQKELDEELRILSEKLLQESQARQTTDAEIRTKVEIAGTGGVHITAVGASWLFVGVFLSTAAPEIAKVLP